jgi:excinuclease ABC subunit B
MQVAIDETNRRRKIQADYNAANDIVPETIIKSTESILGQTKVADARLPVGQAKKTTKNYYIEPEEHSLAADPVMAYMSKDEIEKQIKRTKKNMEKAAKDLDFIEAAKFRDELEALKKISG